MNTGRMVAGGLAAGVIINLAEGIINRAILGDQWKQWTARTAAINQPPSQQTGVILWAIVGFAIGLLGLWLYAAIRPHHRPGPKTAIRVALFPWVACWVLTALQNLALGTVPHHFIFIGAFGGLVIAVIATLGGCAIYKEP